MLDLFGWGLDTGSFYSPRSWGSSSRIRYESQGGKKSKRRVSRLIHRNKIEAVAEALSVTDLTTEERQWIRRYVMVREEKLIAEAISALRGVSDGELSADNVS